LEEGLVLRKSPDGDFLRFRIVFVFVVPRRIELPTFSYAVLFLLFPFRPFSIVFGTW
jgi:hypothetical protein